MSKLRGTVIEALAYDKEARVWRSRGDTFECDAGLMKRMERAGAVRVEKAKTPVAEDKAKRPGYEDKGGGGKKKSRPPPIELPPLPDPPPVEEAPEEATDGES